jgi:WXXGXW repeat (2 copies)
LAREEISAIDEGLAVCKRPARPLHLECRFCLDLRRQLTASYVFAYGHVRALPKSQEIIMFLKRVIGVVFVGTLALGAFAAEVVIQVAPPRYVEHRERMPGHGYVWINGYQNWNGSGYAVVPGRWERPPRPHAHWVAHRWVHRHGGYVMVEGHWR